MSAELEAALAEVLAEHAAWSTARGGRCRCGWTSSKPRVTWLNQHRDHVVAALAPVVVEQVEAALEVAAQRVEDTPNRWSERVGEPAYLAGLHAAAQSVREGVVQP